MSPVDFSATEDRSYIALSTRLSSAPEFGDPIDPHANVRRRVTLVFAALSLIALVVSRFHGTNLPWMIALLIFLVGQVLALVAMVALSWRQDFKGLLNPRLSIAAQLDFDLPHYQKTLEWLMDWPEDVLKRYADFIRLRRTLFEQRMPGVFGPSGSFGILPLTIAVGAQIHEYMTTGSIGTLTILATLFFFWFAFVAWSSQLSKFRIDIMSLLLDEAIRGQAEQRASNLEFQANAG